MRPTCAEPYQSLDPGIEDWASERPTSRRCTSLIKRPSGCSACMPTGCPSAHCPQRGHEQEHGDGDCQTERRAMTRRCTQTLNAPPRVPTALERSEYTT